MNDLKQTRVLADGHKDRLPPHSLEAEQGVLGAILLSPNDNMGECIEQFRGDSEVFYDLRHQAIFSALMQMYGGKQPIDLITLQQRLKDQRELEKIGGFAYLASLPDKAGTAGHLGSYAQVVWEKLILRKVLRICSAIVGRVYEHEGEVEMLLDEIETDILAIAETRSDQGEVPIKEFVDRAITRIEQYHLSQGKPTGLSTGLIDLDRLTRGLHNGELIVIAARPSLGKTSLAMNFIESVALDQKFPAAIFSLETKGESLVERMIFSRARVNGRRVADGNIFQSDFSKMAGAAGVISRSPIHIVDRFNISVLEIRAKARRLKQRYDIRLLVVDYLQLVESASRRNENRQQAIADISRGLKILAGELDIPIIAISQLNRELEKDKGRKPRLSDLRESGAIEQDADAVFLLYQPPDEDGVDRDPNDTSPYPVTLMVAKQRNGPRGEVDLTFLPEFTRFENAAKGEPEDIPQPRQYKD